MPTCSLSSHITYGYELWDIQRKNSPFFPHCFIFDDFWESRGGSALQDFTHLKEQLRETYVHFLGQKGFNSMFIISQPLSFSLGTFWWFCEQVSGLKSTFKCYSMSVSAISKAMFHSFSQFYIHNMIYLQCTTHCFTEWSCLLKNFFG